MPPAQDNDSADFNTYYDENQPGRAARLHAILETAVDAIVTINQNGSIDSVNPATTQLFGYERDELIGQNVSKLMPNPYREEHDGYLQHYQKTGTRKIIGIGREVLGRRKDGTTFPLHLAVSEFQVDGRTLYTGILRDITDLKQAERELADLNERLEDRVKQRTSELRQTQSELVRAEKFATLGKVSGGIAHEIRNPLNAVKTSAYYLLNAKNPGPEKVREHLERIDRQVSLIDNVVTALSDVAKLPDSVLSPLDARKMFDFGLQKIGLPPEVTLKIDLPGDLPRVLADETQLTIAFKNLVRNARDAIEGGGEILITADVDPESVHFHVSDTGCGIVPQLLDQILEPLFTTKARGMGLGLSITRAIVEKNQGRLSVHSEVGQGSRFTIALKRAEP